VNRHTVFLLIFTAIFFRAILPAAVSAAENPLTEDAPKAESLRDTDRTLQRAPQPLDSLFSIYQPYLENISAYKPIYFLVGADPSESRFQFSFRYRFLSPGLSVVKRHHWIQGFHIAYTQTSFWDLDARSQTFRDSSYMPELFFLTPSLMKRNFGAGQVFFQVGYQHESNGRDEDLSRSTNFLYIKPIIIIFNKKTEFGLQIAPKIWTYVENDDKTNPDLKDYRGYVDLEIKAGKAKSVVFTSHFRYAKKGNSLRLDATYPLDNLFENIDLYLQLQYVNALAENLITYQERSRAFRIGFSIVR
jgi:outer membrane phospholipase A